jgi:hypothetical protein
MDLAKLMPNIFVALDAMEDFMMKSLDKMDGNL